MRRFSLTIKIILVLLLAIAAVSVSWYISSNNAKKIKSTVAQISNPNLEQNLVRHLFKQIVLLDKYQKVNRTDETINTQVVANKKAAIQQTIDSLKYLNENNQIQIERLERVEALLRKRTQLMMDYQTVRADYIKSDSFQNQLNQLSSFIQKSYLRNDSSIYKTESSITATTVSDTISHPEEVKQTLWNKLFGKKKEPIVTEIQHFILESMDVSLDTLQMMQDDSVFNKLTKTINNIQSKRQQQQKVLTQKGKQLDEANSVLIDEVLTTLNTIEQENEHFVVKKNQDAVLLIDDTLDKMTMLVVGFVVIIGLLSLWIFWDIIKSNRYKRQLLAAKLEADRLGSVKQQFLSKMSHELRSPLQSIIGYSELLQLEHPKNEHINVIQHSSNHLLQIVNQVLDYNKLINNSLEFYNQPFELYSLLEEVKSLIAIQARQKSLNIIWDNQQIDRNTMVLGDDFRLKQILLNLLHNAIKFTDEGFIKLAVEEHIAGKNVHYTFTIEDSGIGISMENIQRIFNDFEQVNGVHMTEGSGLGLSIVKELVEKQGGTLQVSSEEGIGTQFKIYLSYSLSNENVASIDNVETNLPTRKSIESVWLVEDDVFIQKYCAEIFEQLEIKYQIFSSPSEVLAATPPADLELIFLDIRLPEMMGYELAPILKSKLPNSVLLIALTAQVLPDEIAFIKSCGFNEIVNKPFKMKDIQAILNVEEKATNNIDETNDITTLFRTETLSDIDVINNLLLKGDIPALREIFHKLSSRLSQMEFKELGKEARAIEFQLKEDKLPLRKITILLDTISSTIIT